MIARIDTILVYEKLNDLYESVKMKPLPYLLVMLLLSKTMLLEVKLEMMLALKMD